MRKCRTLAGVKRLFSPPIGRCDPHRCSTTKNSAHALDGSWRKTRPPASAEHRWSHGYLRITWAFRNGANLKEGIPVIGTLIVDIVIISPQLGHILQVFPRQGDEFWLRR